MIPWRSTDREYPDFGEEVLVYGVYIAPDGPYEVGTDFHEGKGVFAQFDSVSHWCYLEEIEAPA